MEYLDAYYLHKVNSLGNLTFQAIFYANICLTLCLIPCGWLRRKVTLGDRRRYISAHENFEV